MGVRPASIEMKRKMTSIRSPKIDIKPPSQRYEGRRQTTKNQNHDLSVTVLSKMTPENLASQFEGRNRLSAQNLALLLRQHSINSTMPLQIQEPIIKVSVHQDTFFLRAVIRSPSLRQRLKQIKRGQSYNLPDTSIRIQAPIDITSNNGILMDSPIHLLEPTRLSCQDFDRRL